MAYSEEEKKQIVDDVCLLLKDGKSLRFSLGKVSISSQTFYDIIDNDSEKSKQYARACEERAEFMFEEILDIVDETENDKTFEVNEDGSITSKVNHEAIQRSKLRAETRKWMLSKMQPKKYGDKLDLTTGGDKIGNLSDEEKEARLQALLEKAKK